LICRERLIRLFLKDVARFSAFPDVDSTVVCRHRSPDGEDVMQVDLQARGFTLTPALAGAVNREAAALAAILGDRPVWLQVRLFDVNSTKGGIDKGCLVAARIGRLRRISVATSIDGDLYRAIPAAFAKLQRAALAANRREHTRRRRERAASFSAQVG
jgi:ribosome-associated translation inhibitor RaiA